MIPVIAAAIRGLASLGSKAARPIATAATSTGARATASYLKAQATRMLEATKLPSLFRLTKTVGVTYLYSEAIITMLDTAMNVAFGLNLDDYEKSVYEAMDDDGYVYLDRLMKEASELSFFEMVILILVVMRMFTRAKRGDIKTVKLLARLSTMKGIKLGKNLELFSFVGKHIIPRGGKGIPWKPVLSDDARAKTVVAAAFAGLTAGAWDEVATYFEISMPGIQQEIDLSGEHASTYIARSNAILSQTDTATLNAKAKAAGVEPYQLPNVSMRIGQIIAKEQANRVKTQVGAAAGAAMGLGMMRESNAYSSGDAKHSGWSLSGPSLGEPAAHRKLVNGRYLTPASLSDRDGIPNIVDGRLEGEEVDERVREVTTRLGLTLDDLTDLALAVSILQRKLPQ